jgi:hypothetical protein
MVCGHLDGACPSPKGTDMKVVGIIYHSRKTRPRFDVWLGGRSCPTNQWTRKVEAYLEVDPYKPFGQAAEAAAAAMQALVSRPLSPLP